MANMDPNAPGNPHGQQSPWRWDASTATVVLVLVALAFLAWVHVSFKGSVSARAGR